MSVVTQIAEPSEPQDPAHEHITLPQEPYLDDYYRKTLENIKSSPDISNTLKDNLTNPEDDPSWLIDPKIDLESYPWGTSDDVEESIRQSFILLDTIFIKGKPLPQDPQLAIKEIYQYLATTDIPTNIFSETFERYTLYMVKKVLFDNRFPQNLRYAFAQISQGMIKVKKVGFNSPYKSRAKLDDQADRNPFVLSESEAYEILSPQAKS